MTTDNPVLFAAMGRHVDVDELIDASAAAELLGLSSRNSVSVYRARYPDFPQPVVSTGTCVLWVRADVESWRRLRRAERSVDTPEV